MAYEIRDGEGSLFKNDRKETQQHPDYRGSIRIGGQDYWLSAWIKSSKDGTKKFMSLSAQPKKEQPAASSGKTVVREESPFDDSIPF